MKNIPLSELVELYRALADPVRLRILSLLFGAGESFVGEMARALELPQSTTSRQLANLRSAGLIQDRRVGTSAYYSLRAGRLPELTQVLEGLGLAAGCSAELKADRERLRRLRSRAGR